MASFITLTSVKINNHYDYYRTVTPTVAEKAPAYAQGETWLNLTTGYSYELTNAVAGTWTQIETDLDALINATKESKFNVVLRYLNNYFWQYRNKNYSDNYESPPLTRHEAYNLFQYESVFAEFEIDGALKTFTAVDDDIYGSIVDSFKEDDIVYVSGGLRNKGYLTIDSISDYVITVNETPIEETARCTIILSIIPADLINIIGRMIWYDIYVRPKVSGMQSERIGTYSYTLAPYGGLAYPVDIISGLDTYAIVDAGGISSFVD